MKISTAGIKLIACGALVAVGLTVGSGGAHAAPAPVEPTAEDCKAFAQIAVDEGESFAEELQEHGFIPAGCPAGPVVVGICVEGHNTVTGEHCYTEGYSDPKDRPAGYPKPPVIAGCDTSVKDNDDDYDCNLDDVASPPVTANGAAENAPVATPQVVVEGVTVSNATPAIAAAATPAKAATLTTPVLAAAATPAAATTAKALPLTGGDITGLVLVAFGALGIGGALVLVDKRRRTA
jgi:LPXTG-motif cell wall-anchored protein